jgi:hypothetical protein
LDNEDDADSPAEVAELWTMKMMLTHLQRLLNFGCHHKGYLIQS